MTEQISFLQQYTTYANLKTTKSVINYNQLTTLFERSGYEIKLELNSFSYDNNQKTFLLKKIEEQDG